MYQGVCLWVWWSKRRELRAFALFILRSWVSGHLPTWVSVVEGGALELPDGALILSQRLTFQNVFPVPSRCVTVGA